jgi:hypothetical protein
MEHLIETYLKNYFSNISMCPSNPMNVSITSLITFSTIKQFTMNLCKYVIGLLPWLTPVDGLNENLKCEHSNFN